MHRDMLLFHCVTPTHNGAEAAIGAIDRPIIREVATGYPFIQSTTIKGAIRAELARDRGPEDPILKAGFGTGAGATGGNQGCVVFSDASLLLLPVRSLAGTFAWVTSYGPLLRFHRLLGRVKQDSSLSKLIQPLLPLANGLQAGNALASSEDTLRIAKRGPICVEGIVAQHINDAQSQQVTTFARGLASSLFRSGDSSREYFIDRVLILSDNDYCHLVRTATQVEANIEIGDTGVTTTGSLRFTEYLPAESIAYSVLSIERPFVANGNLEGIRDMLRTILPLGSNSDSKVSEPANQSRPSGDLEPFIQIGADESTGKGLIRVSRVNDAVSNNERKRS